MSDCPKVPTFVVDYPESMAAAAAIEARYGVARAGVFAGHGRLPYSKAVEGRPLPKEPFVVLNGSGDYHHETISFFEGLLLAHPGKRFTYVQLDAHPDKDDTYRWKLDCASFVGRVMEHEAVERVYLLGLLPEALDTRKLGYNPVQSLLYFNAPYFKKLHTYIVDESPIFEVMWKPLPTSLEEAKANPSVRSVEPIEMAKPGDEKKIPKLRDGPKPALKVHWRTLEDFAAARCLPDDLPVYLTIDLDVLRADLVTDWRRVIGDDDIMPFGLGDNQGAMTKDTLLALVDDIGRARPILGADICGLTAHFETLPDEAKAMSLDTVAEVYAAVCRAIAHGGRASS